MSLSSSDLSGRLKEYLINVDINDCIGLTLTLKQQIQNQKLDHISANQNLRHFLNLLNTRCFGNSFKRFGKTLDRSIEESDLINDYYNCLIECDDNQSSCKRICREVLRE